MNRSGQDAPRDWRGRLPEGVRPYFESAPLAAACLGISSGFAFAMLGATLTTRLAQYGIRKSTVTAFALTFSFTRPEAAHAPESSNGCPVCNRHQ